MKTSAVVILLLMLLLAAPASAATTNMNCTATVQAIGACGSGDNGKAGILFGYWADLTDDFPADPDIQSDALDLRDAICANFGITTNCTAATADGAVRRYLETMVNSYRLTKKKAAVAQPTAPTLDAQANP